MAVIYGKDTKVNILIVIDELHIIEASLSMHFRTEKFFVFFHKHLHTLYSNSQVVILEMHGCFCQCYTAI